MSLTAESRATNYFQACLTKNAKTEWGDSAPADVASHGDALKLKATMRPENAARYALEAAADLVRIATALLETDDDQEGVP